MLFLMLKIFYKCKVFTSLQYGLWQRETNTCCISFYMARNRGSDCFVLAVGSASGRSNTKHGIIFLKMPKLNHIKIVIFKKHFSLSLRNMYGLICFSHDILIYFTFLLRFFAKKSVPKTLFWHIFTISDGLFNPIWRKFIASINHGV